MYGFDSYLRTAVRGMKGNVRILDSADGRSPNLKIQQAWMDQPDCKRFCLGPVSQREALLRSLPSMGYVSILLLVLFYVYAVMGVFLFGQNDPVHFATLQAAFLSLFCHFSGS